MTWVINKAGTDAMDGLKSNVDTPYSKINRYLANAAAIATTVPLYPGETVVAGDTMQAYRSTDMTVGHWELVTPEGNA